MIAGLQNLRRLSPIARLAPFLVGKSSPTAALYFENACSDWLAAGLVKKISPTVFASANTQIIFRHDAGVPLGFSRARTVYFIDDYWENDKSLPWQYQQKSKLVEQRAARFYLPRADCVGVASTMLQGLARRQYPKANVALLTPYWCEPLASFDHFDQSGLEICYLGSASHGNDLGLALPAISAVLKQFPQAHFTLSDQHKLPPDLEAHPRISRFLQSGWQQYRQDIIKRRFHIALYPLQPTPFNAARSNNKLIEHAVVGAATICSDHWQSVSNRVVAVSDNPENWVKQLCALAADKKFAKQVAQTNKTCVENENTPHAQRAFWTGVLWPK